MEERTSPPWSLVSKIFVGLVLLVSLGVLVYNFREALPPLVIACLIAYILTPFVNTLSTRTKIPRGLIILLIYAALLLIISLAVGLLAPLLVRQVTAFQLDLEQVTHDIEVFLSREYSIGAFTLDLGELYTELQGELTGLISPAVSQTIALARHAVTTGVWIIFITLISFYLIRDWPNLTRQAGDWIPPEWRHDFRRLKNEISGVWRDFFRGQFAVGLAMGVSILVLMGGVGLPNIWVLALLAVFLEFLPSLGHGIWLLIAVPLAFFQGSLWLPIPNFWFAVLILVIHLVLEQVDLNFYIPRFVGRRVHLHPMVVIMGIVIGGILAGVLGVFLAAPIISSLRLLVKYVYCKLLDLPPWPQREGEQQMESLSTEGWLQAVWARVEKRIRGEDKSEAEASDNLEPDEPDGD